MGPESRRSPSPPGRGRLALDQLPVNGTNGVLDELVRDAVHGIHLEVSLTRPSDVLRLDHQGEASTPNAMLGGDIAGLRANPGAGHTLVF